MVVCVFTGITLQYLVPGGVPGPEGVCSGGYLVWGEGCTWSWGGVCFRGVYLVPGGVCSSGGVPGPGRCLLLGGGGDVCSGGCLLRGVSAPGGVPGQIPPCGQTHACKHITLPQTSFAGGNDKFGASESTLASYLINCSCNLFVEWLAWFIRKSKQFNQRNITSDINDTQCKKVLVSKDWETNCAKVRYLGAYYWNQEFHIVLFTKQTKKNCNKICHAVVVVVSMLIVSISRVYIIIINDIWHHLFKRNHHEINYISLHQAFDLCKYFFKT